MSRNRILEFLCRRAAALLVLVAGMSVLALSGCCLEARDNEPASVRSKGGAQLWAANCRRCHNYRAPGSFSDDQWETAVNHMRVLAGLTANEARKITEFLKSAN